MKPVVIDLFCGLGGWTRGFLAEGFDAIGFDIERHRYWVPEVGRDDDAMKGTKPVEKRGRTQGCAVTLGMEGANSKPRTRLLEYPAQLVLQDVRTLDGHQFRCLGSRLRCIVASPPCQKYSYMAMPFTRSKKLAAWYREDPARQVELNELFNAAFRIAKEAGVPLILENVKGAQPWVGRAKWHYGSYYLWGDLPALMPSAKQCLKWGDCPSKRYDERPKDNVAAHREGTGRKVPGFNFHAHEKGVAGGSFQSAAVKTHTAGNGKSYGGEFGWDGSAMRTGNSKSGARKAASAMIAEIPFDLAQYIARVFKDDMERVA